MLVCGVYDESSKDYIDEMKKEIDVNSLDLGNYNFNGEIEDINGYYAFDIETVQDRKYRHYCHSTAHRD